MTDQALYELLMGTGISTARTEFKGHVKPPYLVYLTPQSPPIASDHVTVGRMAHYRVEFYNTHKDMDSENKIETALEDAGIVFEKYEVNITEQKLLETIYEFDIVEVK